MAKCKHSAMIKSLSTLFTKIVSETNGIDLSSTMELLQKTHTLERHSTEFKLITQFRNLLAGYQSDEVDIQTLLNHPMSHAIFAFFKNFPRPYVEDHIHLTGSLSAEFIYPRLKKLLEGPNGKIYEEKIKSVYGESSLPILSEIDVDRL